MASISVVNDPLTGGNYGGIKDAAGGDVSTQYTDYINNLFSSLESPAVKPLQSSQYYPSAGQGEQIGSVSNKTMGTMPIFGSGRALFPRAVLDQFRQAQRDAEIEYLTKLGDIDIETYRSAATLENPALQPQFTDKYQAELDTWLDEAATRLGGNYMKAYHALSVDPEYYKMRKKYEEYAAIYKGVFNKAIEIIGLPDDQVSKDSKRAALDFVYKFNNIDELSIDPLLDTAKKLKKHVSVFDVAKNIADGAGERIRTTLRENYEAGKDATSFVYDKTTVEGYTDAEVEEMVNEAKEIYPFLETDTAAQKMLKSQLKVKLGSVYKEEFEKVTKDLTTTGRYLKNNGVKTDENGDVILDSIETGFAFLPDGKLGVGKNGVVYPKKDQDGKPIVVPTISGMGLYIKDRNNQIRFCRVPGTFNMAPNAEYDLSSPQGWPYEAGRYIEGQIDFKNVRPYQQKDIKVLTEGGRVKGEYATGQYSKASEEEVPLVLKDELTGETIKLYGTFQVLAPFDGLKDQVQQTMPFTNRMHNRLPKESKSAPTGSPRYADQKPSLSIPDPDKEIFKLNGYKYSYNELKKDGYSDEDIMRLEK